MNMPTGFFKLFLIFNVILTIGCASDDQEKEEQGFCEKTDEGVTCVSEENLRLTRLDGGQVGDMTTLTLKDGRKLQMKTLNLKPLVFEIEDFLSDEECDHFITMAKGAGMESSITARKPPRGMQLSDLDQDKVLNLEEMKLTIQNNFRIYLEDEDVIEMYKELETDPNNDNIITQDELKVSPKDFTEYLNKYLFKFPEKNWGYRQHAMLYLGHTTDTVLQSVQKRISEVVELPLDLIRLGEFQVLNYGVKGHINAHLDSTDITEEVPCCENDKTQKCRECRYMTFEFFLNDVTSGGETAFPFANKESIDEKKANEERAHHMYKKCEEAGLRVAPKKRKAVLWYNHALNEETGWKGDIDVSALKGSCEVTEGEKWSANFWIRISDKKSTDLEKIKELPPLE